MAHTIERQVRETREDAPSGGGFISEFNPVAIGAEETAKRVREFEERFIMTMKDDAKSVLSTDVYHDGKNVDLTAFKDHPDDYQALSILLNHNAWKKVNNAKKTYDQDVIDSALDDGLLSHLKGDGFHMVSYGPGPNGTATDKEGRIIARMIESGMNVHGLTAIDVNRTFVLESSMLMGDKFDIPSRGVQGDFVWGKPHGLPEIDAPADVTKVVTIFGNTPFNAASYNRDGKEISYRDSVENFFSKMNVQNGLGHYLILTIDTDQVARSQEKRYMATQEHEGLILTPFALARHRGIIDRPYPIFAHWRMAVEYDKSQNTVLMMAASKGDHTMPLRGGRDIEIKEGECRVIMASHKWGVNTHMGILANSGYEISETFEDANNPHKVILAKAVRAPRFEPF